MEHEALFTPKDLATAIGASESSVRRWVDNGDIRMSRTAGGHRRIPLAEAVRFVRSRKLTIAKPEILGLDPNETPNAELIGLTDDQKLFEILHAGDRQMARSLISSWFLAGRSLPSTFDGPIKHAMHRMGEVWKHDPRGILIEHRATEICIESIGAIRSLLPHPEETAPLSLGGGSEGDPYSLPTMMVGATLAELGFRDINFGPNTPVELLGTEAIERRAKMVWLSVSSPADPKRLGAQIARLLEKLSGAGIHLVVGGQRYAALHLAGAEKLTQVDSMSELAAFARGLMSTFPTPVALTK